ncbi:MAG: S8 family serine peptidase [Actinomycetota bacterium]|nr:S8 family serine peptidase [Actinomycetota bacterium]
MVQIRRRWGTVLLALILAYALLLVVAPASQGQTSDLSETQPSSGTSANSEHDETPNSSNLFQKARREGSVRIIVRLRTDDGFVPEGRLDRTEVSDQRDEIEGAQAGLQEDLQGTEYQTLREYETIPYIALNVSPQALQALQRSSLATDIVEDRLDEANDLDKSSSPKGLDSTNLAQSTPLVQAPTMWANGFTGSGQVVAVLDTGVDSAHPFLAGKVVEEACFTSNRAAGAGNCPNGTSTQIGAGSGVPCTYAPSACRHGTHVAGIAAGQGSTFSGVAKGANVMSVQVFSRFTGSNCIGAGEDPCALSWTSDQIAGLERVFLLRTTRTFSSVNMSLGGGQFFSNCDTDARKPIIDNLRSAGIATVISSGNNGFTDSMGAPACISSAVSVGSTTKSDTLSSFSNSASFLSLLAPGESINSSVPGGGFAFFNGTSMAAPHVAGAWALLKQQTPSASVNTLLSNLQSTGLGVTDTRVAGGVTKPRIRIADAAGIPPGPPNDNFASAQVLNGFSASANGTNLGATLESADPTTVDTRSTSHTVWYRWTAPFSGAVEMNTCTSDFDTLLGVYTGSALGSLTQAAANDDGCALGSKVTFNATKNATYRILVDGFTGQQGTFTLQVIDKAAPKVTSTSPANNAKGIAPGANIKATFSEAMEASTFNTATFKLKKAGTTTFLGATVTYDPATKKATLDPNKNLKTGSTYVATVMTGVQDEAGNSLDQDSSLAGNQTKSWKFRVG